MSGDESERESETRPRSKSVATALASLCPGLGYLYVGRFTAGLVANACFVGLLIAFVALWTLLEFLPLLPGAVLLAGWIVFTGLVVRDVREIIDERDDPYELRSYNHWTIYSAVYLLAFVLPLAAVILFTGSFFWATASVDTAAMYPNLAPGDTVLIRKNGYRNESPGPGDLVAVQFPGSDGYRVLRVVATGPTTVRRGANNLEVGQRTLPQIPLEATPGSMTARASRAMPPAAPSKPPESSDQTGEDGEDGAPGEADEQEPPGQLNPEDYELMVERNAAAKYVVSLRPSATAKPSFETDQLEKNELFLLADNRSAPERQTGDADVRDSRVFGPVRRDAISGKPMFIAWSADPSTGSIRWNRIGFRLQ